MMVTDPQCPACRAPVQLRTLAGTDGTITVTLDLHGSPVPVRNGYVLRVDGTIEEAGPATTHVYPLHPCQERLAQIFRDHGLLETLDAR